MIIVLPLCDTNYCQYRRANIKHVDLGQYESGNDSGVLKNSLMEEGFEHDTFSITSPAKFQESKKINLSSLLGMKFSH